MESFVIREHNRLGCVGISIIIEIFAVKRPDLFSNCIPEVMQNTDRKVLYIHI